MIKNENKVRKGHHKGNHEHFFKCNSCNTIESFQDCLIYKKEEELQKAGYTDISHHLEITGICPSCTQL